MILTDLFKIQSSPRETAIIRTYFIGIVMNIFLSVSKLIVGLSINSTAMVLDASEGLSDIMSWMITVIMTKLSGRKPDRKHPMGYGRIEYISALITIIMIGAMGVKAIIEIIDDLLHPDEVEIFSISAVIIMIISIIFKFAYGSYAKNAGKKYNSIPLMATGMDTFKDSLTSIGILSALLIRGLYKVNIEPYVSMIIVFSIFKTVVSMITGTMDHLLGTSSDPEYVRKIKKLIISQDSVENVFNLVVHDYGEGHSLGSVNIEVNKNMRADELTVLSHRIKRVCEKEGLILTSVGISGTDLENPDIEKMWDNILAKVKKYPEIERAYGLSVDFKDKVIFFYVLCDPGADEDVLTKLKEDISRSYRGMRVKIETILEG